MKASHIKKLSLLKSISLIMLKSINLRIILQFNPSNWPFVFHIFK